VPFVLRRVPKDISRPLYDSKAKAYKGGYGRGTAYPIVITEDPQWLEFWQTHMRRQMILQMVDNGQASLLQDSDRAILQEMQSISLPMAQALPVIDTPVPAAISPAPQPALEPADEPTIDTAAIADEDAAAEYREAMLSRPSADRIAAVNEHLKLSREMMLDLWGQTAEETEEPPKTLKR